MYAHSLPPRRSAHQKLYKVFRFLPLCRALLQNQPQLLNLQQPPPRAPPPSSAYNILSSNGYSLPVLHHSHYHQKHLPLLSAHLSRLHQSHLPFPSPPHGQSLEKQTPPLLLAPLPSLQGAAPISPFPLSLCITFLPSIIKVMANHVNTKSAFLQTIFTNQNVRSTEPRR